MSSSTCSDYSNLLFRKPIVAPVPGHHPAGAHQHGGGGGHLRHQVPEQAGQAGPGDGAAGPLQLHPHEIHPPQNQQS
jgi:hypothetical protein